MARIVPLDLLFPRPVLVTLAGEPRKAGGLTLGDLATLQSWLRQAGGGPLDGLLPVYLDPDPDSRRARLVAAWHEAKSWPPALGSAADGPLLNSPEGRAVFLVLVLGRWDDGFTAEAATALAGKMDATDWQRLRRIAWGLMPWQELAGEIDPDWAEARRCEAESSDGADWAEVVVDVIKATGLDFAALEKMTPTQISLLCSGGKLGEYRAHPRPGESAEEFGERMREMFEIDKPVISRPA